MSTCLFACAPLPNPARAMTPCPRTRHWRRCHARSPQLHLHPDLLRLHFSAKSEDSPYALPSIFASSNVPALFLQVHCNSDVTCMVPILQEGIQFSIVVQTDGTPFCPFPPCRVSFTTTSIAVGQSNKKESPRSPHDLMRTSACP